MSAPTNEEIAHRYFEASAHNDLDALEALRTADWHAIWPATGELVPNSAAYRAIHERFPGGYPRFDTIRILGVEDRYAVTPANTVIRVAGSGDIWIGSARLRYADGGEWYTVKVIELLDGLVRRDTDYWAPHSDPPASRDGLTERLPQADVTEG